MSTTYYESPIGLVEIMGSEKGITHLSFVEKKSTTDEVTAAFAEKWKRQIREYFEGQRTSFDVPLSLEGTDFQKKVWAGLGTIPFGRTVTYKDIAALVGNDKASRAVGNSNHVNKIAILIPCHRVIQSNGDLGGYATGNWRKKWLIEHERQWATEKL